MIEPRWLRIALVALTASTILAAFPAAARTLTVDQAVDLALEHSLILDAAEAGEDKAQAEATEALLQFFPKANVTGSYTRLDQVPYMEFDTSAFLGGSGSGGDPCAEMTEDDVPAGFTLEMAQAMCEMIMGWMSAGTSDTTGPTRIEMGVRDNYRVSASLEQIIFAGGALHQGRAAAMDLQRASHQQVRAARLDAAFGAEQGFYQVVAAQRAVQVTEAAVDMVEAYVDDLGNLLEVGMASRSDLLAAQVQLSQAKLDAMKMAHMTHLAEMSFRVLLGLPRDEPLDLVMGGSPSLDDLPAARDELLSTALQQRPDLAGLDYTLDAMKHGSNAVWASWLPAVVVVANLNWANPNYSLEPEWYRSGDITVALSWSVWDRGAALTRNRAARAAHRQLSSQRELLAEMMSVELEAAVTSFDASVAELDVAREGLARATESLRLEQERFSEGVANNIQLLQAQTDVAVSELTVLQAETQMHVAHASLRKAVGMEPEVSR